MPAISFQAIFDKALADYCAQIGVELDKHPFINELRGRDSPENVLKLLEDKANAFKVYRDGNRKLINWLSPLVRVIHTLSSILAAGSQAVPFQPAQAIFAGVDVLITAAGGISSSYDALVDLFECIGNFLNRLRIYTDILITPSMTHIVVKIMVELLSVFALATKQIKQGRLKKFAKKLLGESEIEAVLQRLDRLTQEEGRMTIAQTLEVVYGLMNNVKVVMNDGKASTDSIRKALDTMQQMASDINKMRRDQMQKDSKAWLCPPDPSKNYNIGCKTHQDGTASWFFLGSVFYEWDAKGSLLWIHGKPGSGKSILLSSIIRKIDTKRKAGLASMAYFYFDFRDTEKQHLRGLLSSLVFQLSAKSDPCHQILSRLYSDHAGGAEEPSEVALSECLVEMLEVPGQPAMYIIIDALDECPNISGLPTAREQVLKFLEHLVKLDLPNVHICTSSRPEIDIRNILEPLTSFRMSLHDESGQKQDISSYIHGVVYADQRMRKWTTGDKQLVIDTLSDKADGMFRWVFCQLEVLRRTLPAHIRRTVDEMPKTLDETYEHALLMIDEEMRQCAQRLFHCLAVSIRPLRVEELADILAVRFDAGALPKFNPDWRPGNPEEAVLSVCSNLISVVDVDGSQIVQFSHFSVKEFLTSDRLATAIEDLSGYYIRPHSAHTILAQASLSILLQLDDHIEKDDIKNFPLSAYAAQHWVAHGQFEGVSPVIQIAMEHLFNPDKLLFANWVWIYDMDDPWRGDIPTMRPERLEAAPLYYAVLCGFHQLIEHLIANHPGDINARGGYYETPLLAAFVKGDIDIALLLLRRGADVDVFDKSGTSPLHRAAESGRIDIVRLLLEHNADVNLPDTSGYTPLHLASFAGEVGISRLLLQHGADVNFQNSNEKDGFSPLHAAAQNGHVDVVRHLIESGANINCRDDDDQTPLYVASKEGHVKTAEELIQRGADVGSRSNDDSTPLHVASLSGCFQMAELFTQHGADLNSRDNDGRTPLHAASYKGHVKTAELLIRCGADPGPRDNEGRTPLFQTLFDGHLAMAELLIQHGVNVTTRNNDGWTPLHNASQMGHTKIAELLIRHGADVDSRLNDGSTPLREASCWGQMAVAELLIHHGADLGSRDNDGRTPLHAASHEGHVKMAELLIRRGADPGPRDNYGQTPLFQTLFEGNMAMVELLIQHGVDVATRDNDGWTPLHYALERGHTKIAELFIRHGADVDSRLNNGSTPLHEASCSDQMVVAELLIHHGADLGSRDNDGRTPLHAASYKGHVKTAELLIRCGADPGPRDNEGRTPLFQTLFEGHIAVAELLIQHGVDVATRDDNGFTPLHDASQMGHTKIAELFIRHGADVDSRLNDGSTPLHLAALKGRLDTAKLLLECGADLSSRDNEGQAPLHLAALKGRLDTVKLLLKCGADLGSRDNEGRAPLHLAALKGRLDTVKLLLECGADRNLHDNKNMTSLDLASDNQKLEVANFLSQSAQSPDGEVNPAALSTSPQTERPDVVQSPVPHGGNVEPSNEEQPSLFTASKNGQVDVVRSLLDHGSDVEDRASLRQTALFMASEFGQLEVAELLIERGANVNSRDVNGSTPLHRASQNDHIHVVRLLLHHNADVNARQRDQRTALDLAACMDRLEITELLLERGANPYIRNNYGRTPRQEALAYGCGRIVELLSKHEARA